MFFLLAFNFLWGLDGFKTLDSVDSVQLQRGKQLMDVVRQFHGGQAELEKVNVLLIHSIYQREYRANLSSKVITLVNCKAPAYVVNMNDRTVQGFDGALYWHTFNSTSKMNLFQNLPQLSVEEASQRWAEFLLVELFHEFTFAWIGDESIEGHLASQVRVFNPKTNQMISDLWVLSSGQILRQDIASQKGLESYYYEGYKTFGHLNLPAICRFKGKLPYTETIQSLQINPEVDSSAFHLWPDDGWFLKCKDWQ